MQMVVQRELRAGSRRLITYWGRFGAAAVAIFVLWQLSQASNGGRDLFNTLAIIATALCLLDAIRRAAASIADEKSEGTLGLLVLTPLSGSELLFGKFVSVAIGALPLAVAVMPIFGICVLLGGVSGGEFFRLSITILHLLTIAIFVGIVASCTCRTSLGASFAALIILGFGVIISTALAAQKVISPLAPADLVLDIQYRASPALFWSSILVTQMWVFALLWLFGRNFAKRWRREEEFQLQLQISYAPRPTVAAPSPSAAQENYKRLRRYWGGSPRWFEGSPITWLTLREMNMFGTSGLGIGAAAVCALFALTPIGLFYAFVFSFGLVVMLCIASARTFAVARQSGSMELLITTPLGIEGVIEGHLAALRKMFLWPGVIMVATFVFFLIRQRFASGLDLYDRWRSRGSGLEWYALSGFALLLLATPWIGMWMGLRSKTPARAVLATLGLVLILPRFGGCMMIDAIYFTFLGFFARHRVYENFRQLTGSPARQLTTN